MNLKCLSLSIGLALVPTGLFAQGHDEHAHDDHGHEAAAGAITVSHPWARAAASGEDTLVFMEFVNSGEADTLESVSSDLAAEAGIVGVSFSAGDMQTIPFEQFEIPAGEFDFDPAGVAILLTGLNQDLAQGDVFELELDFHHAGSLHVDVEVEAANATEHSHAGHSH